MISVPTSDECFYLIEKHEVMDHIREHCRKVAEVGVFLAEQLKTAGLVLNTDLIQAAGLLHDIAKLRALEEGVDHAELGAAILEGAGYPAIASIVKQHVRLSSPVTGTPISEAEVVNYADKRVLHTTVVSLEERFDYIRVKYGRSDSTILERIDATEERTMRLEAKLFRHLSITPRDVPP